MLAQDALDEAPKVGSHVLAQGPVDGDVASDGRDELGRPRTAFRRPEPAHGAVVDAEGRATGARLAQLAGEADQVLDDLARIMREGVDSGRDTRASVWYKRSIYKRLATTEAPA